MNRSVPLIGRACDGRCSKTGFIIVILLTASLSFLIPPSSSAEQPSSEFQKLLKQAERGDAWSQAEVGQMYLKGQGVAQDFKEAVKWYRAAAGQGHRSAQNNLGSMYVRGEGAPQDYIEAHKWFNLAAEQGHARATRSRDNLAEKMTADQIAEAQRLVLLC